MTNPVNDPRHPANRFPWHNPDSRARANLEQFLAVAEERIDASPDRLPFPPAHGRMVISWLRALLDRAPHQIREG